MPLELCLLKSQHDVTLHQFRPARVRRRDTTLDTTTWRWAINCRGV
jgi:hypothetical protein